jgi:hypothetical protein
MTRLGIANPVQLVSEARPLFLAQERDAVQVELLKGHFIANVSDDQERLGQTGETRRCSDAFAGLPLFEQIRRAKPMFASFLGAFRRCTTGAEVAHLQLEAAKVFGILLVGVLEYAMEQVGEGTKEILTEGSDILPIGGGGFFLPSLHEIVAEAFAFRPWMPTMQKERLDNALRQGLLQLLNVYQTQLNATSAAASNADLSALLQDVLMKANALQVELPAPPAGETTTFEGEALVYDDRKYMALLPRMAAFSNPNAWQLDPMAWPKAFAVFDDIHRLRLSAGFSAAVLSSRVGFVSALDDQVRRDVQALTDSTRFVDIAALRRLEFLLGERPDYAKRMELTVPCQQLAAYLEQETDAAPGALIQTLRALMSQRLVADLHRYVQTNRGDGTTFDAFVAALTRGASIDEDLGHHLAIVFTNAGELHAETAQSEATSGMVTGAQAAAFEAAYRAAVVNALTGLVGLGSWVGSGLTDRDWAPFVPSPWLNGRPIDPVRALTLELTHRTGLDGLRGRAAQVQGEPDRATFLGDARTYLRSLIELAYWNMAQTLRL